MQAATFETVLAKQHFPPFDLEQLLQTVFEPKRGEKLCILIDLENPQDILQFAFLKKEGFQVQKKAYSTFLEGLHPGCHAEVRPCSR